MRNDYPRNMGLYRIGEMMSSASVSRLSPFMASVAIGIMVTVAGCSVTVGGNGDSANAVSNIPQAELESGLKKAITEKTGAPIKSVTCEGPLRGVVGETQRCVASFATSDGLRAGVTATTTSVADSKINYDFKVDDEPME
ncbi:DUF4333 domain-containing protein [Mycolicibacterium sp. HK-90]|uniref:DUF4333 domain-containing protein n=1 Tax=Mycolicibacterium sp. HK-90 TaxID=3056937 RepID=UPI00265B4B22|nr:DUF4333 domain-containing protein [Mycolicibacterium sp. HK-90]WKG02499.1 DUF4333 domain-containing protein [Mycolicibacterium sp. HK-90]